MTTESGLDERVVLCGQTATGEIVPITVDSDGEIIAST
jgi:hypothetical protein